MRSTLIHLPARSRHRYGSERARSWTAAWLNAVEGVFALLAKRRLKRGVFRSLAELKQAIHSFIANTNANPKPFIWTKDTKSSPLFDEGTKR